ncbi:cyclin-dependent kinase G-1-like [Andrographis paniculata]|uniref:cyclin-dependent kinase G-1-like n=1 Tax=Andrographis paniculata TaxID=175694 RepID=UPI0021E91BE4|nr:cyclin-dependent kinase G-1-like [Andrographis paniculata]
MGGRKANRNGANGAEGEKPEEISAAVNGGIRRLQSRRAASMVARQKIRVLMERKKKAAKDAALSVKEVAVAAMDVAFRRRESRRAASMAAKEKIGLLMKKITRNVRRKNDRSFANVCEAEIVEKSLERNSISEQQQQEHEIDEVDREKKKEEALQWLKDAGIFELGSMDQYEPLRWYYKSRGSFGSVTAVRENSTKEIMVMKKVREGMTVNLLREIQILNQLNGHPSIVRFKEVVLDGDSHDEICIVMEYVKRDLRKFIKNSKRSFTLSEVKNWMRQLFEGVKFIHENEIIHRDIKPSNILIGEGGDLLKICDFGVSAPSATKFVGRAGTRQYAAPEILLRPVNYSTAVDMWAVGCVMGEMFLRETMFRGRDDIVVISEIFKVLGTPEDISNWPRLRGQDTIDMLSGYANVLEKKFTNCSPKMTESGLDLLKNMLTYDPTKRITAEAALNHAWFAENSDLSIRDEALE